MPTTNHYFRIGEGIKEDKCRAMIDASIVAAAVGEKEDLGDEEH